MKIGFIGLGIMGKPMAKNLLRAGHALTVYDISTSAVEELVREGGAAAKSPAEVAKCEIIVTMLPNSPQVKTVVMGENGVLCGAKKGTILIDMSSIDPAVSKEVFTECEKKGVKMIDAPVSGGEPKAVDGTLAIMVGGDEAVFLRVKHDVLLHMGASAVYCGGIGAGNTTKLANQIIVACNIAACAEGFTLAKKAGVDPEKVFHAIKGGLAGSTVMNAKVPMMLENNFKPGFKIDLHIKDLSNALCAGHDVGATLPLTATVMEMLQTLHADGKGQDDHASLVNYYAKVSNVSIGTKEDIK